MPFLLQVLDLCLGEKKRGNVGFAFARVSQGVRVRSATKTTLSKSVPDKPRQIKSGSPLIWQGTLLEGAVAKNTHKSCAIMPYLSTRESHGG